MKSVLSWVETPVLEELQLKCLSSTIPALLFSQNHSQSQILCL